MTDSESLIDSMHGRWLDGLKAASGRVSDGVALVPEGRLRRMIGLTLEAEGCSAAVGDLCAIRSSTSNAPDVDAEVVGFSDDRLLLMPTGRVQGLTGNMRVRPARRSSTVSVGESLLGLSLIHI